MPPDDERAAPDASPTVPFADSPGALLPTLEPGQLLAGRYRVRRFIAQGGMGEVWEAEDLELPGERVALKTIRPEIAGDAWAMGRFRREIQLGRKVTHPNVCRIFDLFHHRPAAGTEGTAGTTGAAGATVTFLTMELLEGETLAQRLESQGRMAPAEALPLVAQMAAALEAAHAAGVVHGDFKSSNVMLQDGPRAPRAVVTDFGLARWGHGERGLATSIVGTEQLVGTPAYMAPELMRGERTSAAADVYALGVVLFEMVTGNLPFEGQTPFAAAVRRLTEPPTPPRSLVPDLEARWEEAILRCLAADPAERFASAGDVARFLAGEEVRRRRSRPRRAAAVLAAALAVIAILVAAVWLGRRSAAPPGGGASPPAAATVAARRAIAVLGFKNTAGLQEAAWLATGLGEMLATELAAGDRLRVVPAESVARMRVELELGEFDSLADDTLGRVRRYLGADLVVLGSYFALPGPERRLRVDVKLQGGGAGASPVVTENGTEAELFDLVARLGVGLRRELGVEPVSAGEAAAARAAFPADPAAARAYSEGLARLRLFDAVAARDFFARAAELAPDQPLPHAGLAAAWAELGYDQHAREEAKLAHELGTGLPREQLLAVEGRYREAVREWPRAIEVYETLFAFFPESLEYGLRLAEARLSAGQAEEARATLQALRRLPPPAGEDPRIDLATAQAAAALSDYAGQRDAAQAAQKKGEEMGARLVVAKARFTQGAAWRSLGDLEQASQAIAEARQAFLAAGDRSSAARAVNTLGIVAWQRGDLEEARARYEEALTAFRQIGDQRGVAQSLNNIAIVLYQQKDLAGAKEIYSQVLAIHRATGNRQLLATGLVNLGAVLGAEDNRDAAASSYREALAIYREIGDRQGEGMALNNIARGLRQRGDLVAAERHYREALDTFRSVGDKDGEADVLNNVASLAWRQGDLRAAEASWRQALQRKREVGARPGVAMMLVSLGDVFLAKGDLDAAWSAYEESAALRHDLGDVRREAASRVALATVADARGDFARAVELARAAAAQGTASGDVGIQAEAEAQLAASLHRLGSPDALDALARAREAARAAPDPELALIVAITRVRLSRGGDQGAREELATALQRAQAVPPVLLLEARLLLAIFDLAREPAAAVGELREIHQEARALGFVRLANEAERHLTDAAAEG